MEAREKRVQLLLTLRTLEDHHDWKLHHSLEEAEQEQDPARLREILADVTYSQRMLDWCREQFKRFLPSGSRPMADLLEVVRQREGQDWSFARIAEHWGVAEPSARALYQRARKAVYV